MIVEDSDPSGVGTLDVSYSDIWDTDGVNGMSNQVGSMGTSPRTSTTRVTSNCLRALLLDAGDPSALGCRWQPGRHGAYGQTRRMVSRALRGGSSSRPGRLRGRSGCGR